MTKLPTAYWEKLLPLFLSAAWLQQAPVFGQSPFSLEVWSLLNALFHLLGKMFLPVWQCFVHSPVTSRGGRSSREKGRSHLKERSWMSQWKSRGVLAASSEPTVSAELSWCPESGGGGGSAEKMSRMESRIQDHEPCGGTALSPSATHPVMQQWKLSQVGESQAWDPSHIAQSCSITQTLNKVLKKKIYLKKLALWAPLPTHAETGICRKRFSLPWAQGAKGA